MDAGAPPAPGPDEAAPTGPGGERLVSANHVEAQIDRAVSDIARKSGKTIIARGKTSGQRVTVMARNEPIERVLDKLVNSKPNWLWYKPDGKADTYEIWDQESFKAEVLPTRVRQKVFTLREINAEEAFKAIQGSLTPNLGAASFDPRSNKVLVTDLPYVLEFVQRLIDQIDVKFITRVFYIQHADVGTIAEKLSNLKSPAAPTPETDERTRQIIVRDRLDVIRQMDLLVETLDVGPEMRVYDLNNLGYQGDGMQDVEDAIQDILTPNAYFKINYKSGKMIVQDVPEVQEKIEAILSSFDQPAKQVMLQVEIIETVFQNGFDYSIDYTISQDLFSAVIDGLAPGVPKGSQPINPTNLGFLNFQEEFPIASVGSGGVNAQYLTKNAFFKLKAAMSDTRTRVLQQPQTIVKNQEEAIFSVGERLPYFTGGNNGYVNSSTGQYNGSYGGNVQFVQSGLDLSVRPTINNNGLVEMQVDVVNNTATIKNDILYQGQANSAPEVKNQEIQTVMIVPSGETRVMGGLVKEGMAETRKGVPYLTKIPVVGPLLFGSVTRPDTDNGRANLLLFITPTIINEKPQEMLKYRGRAIASVRDADREDKYPKPAPTLSDTQIEPIPVPVAVPARPGKGNGSTDSYRKAVNEAVAPMPEASPAPTPATEDWAPPSEPELLPSSDALNGDQASGAPDANGLTDIRRIRIEDKVETGALSRVPTSIQGPRGNLTGASGPTAGQPATGAYPGQTSAPPPAAVPGPPRAATLPAGGDRRFQQTMPQSAPSGGVQPISVPGAVQGPPAVETFIR